jgi:flagellar biosynthesis chaperone FliJ
MNRSGYSEAKSTILYKDYMEARASTIHKIRKSITDHMGHVRRKLKKEKQLNERYKESLKQRQNAAEDQDNDDIIDL